MEETQTIQTHQGTQVATYRPHQENGLTCQCFSFIHLALLLSLCAGKLICPLQLSSVLGGVAGLQSVLGACGVWSGAGHHAHWSPHLLHWSAVEEQTILDLQCHG